MKNLINSALLVLALNPLCALAVEITRSAAAEACSQQAGENSGECLEAAGLASDNALKQAFNAKVTELQNFDYTRWPQGDEARRTQMVEALKISQQQLDGRQRRVLYGSERLGRGYALACRPCVKLRHQYEPAPRGGARAHSS